MKRLTEKAAVGTQTTSSMVSDGSLCGLRLCCIFGLIWYFGALGFEDFAGFEKMVILRFLIFGF